MTSRTESARESQTYDIAIIGGGIVGLATARELTLRSPDLSVIVLEAEGRVAAHQSGHNSGVIHSGIYYRPGSEKAICCRQGKQLLEDYCKERSIPWDRCGKVVVATDAEEKVRLDSIAERATANGVEFSHINTDELRRLEPSVAGIAALHVPETGIVDYAAVCEHFREQVTMMGGEVRLDWQVRSIQRVGNTLRLGSQQDVIECGQMINCGGLQCDRVFRMAGGESSIRIVPFRGEYYDLIPERQPLCRNLIYPVPDPKFPFLGVHFTRMIGGGVECGPNAVLALAREGYRWADVNLRDLSEAITFRGFQTLARNHWRMGLGEIHRSLSKRAFVKALQRLIPSIRSEDLVAGRAGVRAQAIQPDGKLVDDFLIERTENAIHVLNAPSPAATASMSIAKRIADRI
ncbi:MAG: L-2-hydroxyglutarate oxidase [Planctomycetota bacterium]